MKRIALALALLAVCVLCAGWIHGSYSWNGGLVQINPWSNYFAGDYPFINQLLNATDWTYGDNSGPVNINEANAEGLPTNNTSLSAHSGWKTGFFIPTQAEDPGNYTLDWVGNIAITPPGTFVSISGSGCSNPSGNESSGTNCTATYSETGQGGSSNQEFLTINAVGSPLPTQVRFYNSNHAAALSACGNPWCFSPQFINVMSYFGVIRFMDKSNSNTQGVATWTDRTPTNYWSYAAIVYPTATVTTNQVTNSSGAEYTLADTGIALTDKTHIIANFAASITAPSYTTSGANSGSVITFTADPANVVAGMLVADNSSGSALFPDVSVASVNHSAHTVTLQCPPQGTGCSSPINGGTSDGHVLYFSPLLNVNSTGNVPMVTPSATPLGSPFGATEFYANWTLFTYDAALNVWMLQNSNGSNNGLAGGWPPEAEVALANAVRAHPWFVSPTYAVDPPTNYTSSLAAYVKANLSSGLIPRFEGPNETWNYVFNQTSYADNKEFLKTGTALDHDNAYGQWISQLCQTVSSTYGANTALYQCIAGMSLDDDGGLPTKGGGGQANKLDSPAYVAEGGSAAYNWVTNIAPAIYWQSGYFSAGTSTIQEIGYAYWYQTASPTQQSTLITDFLSGNNTTGIQGTLAYNNSVYPSFATFAAAYTGIVMTSYEGGYSNGNSYNNATQTAAVTSVTTGTTTTLTIGSNAWNYIYNTASLTGATTQLSGICTALNGQDATILSATATTIVVNINTTGGCTYGGSGGTAAYDGSSTYIPAFELGVQLSPLLASFELTNMQNFYNAGGRFPSEYAATGVCVWCVFDPDSYATSTPKINAVREYQQTPFLLNRDLPSHPANDDRPVGLNEAA